MFAQGICHSAESGRCSAMYEGALGAAQYCRTKEGMLHMTSLHSRLSHVHHPGADGGPAKFVPWCKAGHCHQSRPPSTALAFLSHASHEGGGHAAQYEHCAPRHQVHALRTCENAPLPTPRRFRRSFSKPQQDARRHSPATHAREAPARLGGDSRGDDSS